LEREILGRALKAETMAKEIRLTISEQIREKALRLSIRIPEEVSARMCDSVEEKTKKFKCKHCGKEFSDGRQLGGHISRAHFTKETNKNPTFFQDDIFEEF
jgi:transposase-like protein